MTADYSRGSSTKQVAASSGQSLSAASRLSNYTNRAQMARRAERDAAAAVVPALAAQAYHIPGNTWRQDWLQYFGNNHPIFGFCFHHKLHPMGTWKRIIVLIGSIACGLTISNILYLYFLSTDEGINPAISVDFHLNSTLASQGIGVSQLSLSNYQITLWTLGTSVHTMFDLSVWYTAACGCCLPGGRLESLGGLRWMGNYVVLFAVIVTAAVASLVVVVRATLVDHPDVDPTSIHSGGLFDDAIPLGQTSSPDDYKFLAAWCIELLISWFAINFIFGTILFSGILGCYRLPFLGGRPREVMLHERERLKHTPTVSDADNDEEYGQSSPSRMG